MLAFIAGVFVGAWLGIACMAMLALSKEADERTERILNKEGKE